MKKLLSMIGAMTLIGTASTGVVACNGGETPNPKPDERTDISNKIKNSIDLRQLSANTKIDFLAKLQTALAQITDLNTITPSDYDVYKVGTTIAIQDSDITAGTSLNIKIVAKDSSKNFKGIKDNIEINYTKKDTRIDLNTIIINTSLDKIVMLGTIPNKIELLNAIKENNSKANTLSESDFDFEGSANATNATIEGKTNYKGKVTLTYQKDTSTDLSTIITKTSLDKIEMLGTVPTKKELLKGIKENNSKANTLSESDFDFEGSANATNATIEGKTNYKGKVTLTYQKDTSTDLSTITQLTGLNINANSTATNNDLWAQILNANEFKNLRYNSYKTFMYKTNDLKDTTDIKQLNQQKGDIYIILQIRKNEGINCFGDTPRLKVTLK